LSGSNIRKGESMQLKYIIFLLLLTPNVQAQNITVDGMGDTNYDLELCYAYNRTCIDHDHNETIDLNEDYDYILKIKPVNINDTKALVGYTLDETFSMNLLLFMIFLFFVLAVVWVISNVK